MTFHSHLAYPNVNSLKTCMITCGAVKQQNNNITLILNFVICLSILAVIAILEPLNIALDAHIVKI